MCQPIYDTYIHTPRQGASSSPHGCLATAPPRFLLLCFLLLLMTSPINGSGSDFFFLRHLQHYLLDLLSSSSSMASTSSSTSSSNSSNQTTLVATTLLVFALLVTLLLLLLGLSRQQPNASSRDRHKDTTAAPFHTTTPFFLTAGSTVEQERAARSALKGTLEHYRAELGVRMQAISRMVDEQLPIWEKETGSVSVGVGGGENKEQQRDLSALVTKRFQERIWKEMEGLPAWWEANAELLWRLLRLPAPICALPDIRSTTQEEEAATRGGTQTNEDPQGSVTPTSTSTYNDGVQVFTHLYRDWSADGHDIRRKTYDPILRAVARLFPRSSSSSSPPATKILVPGAGLGRLAFELAYGEEGKGGGHSVTALDISPVMIAATASVLGVVLSSSFASREREEGGGEEGREFYPFLHDPLLNQRSHALRFYAAKFPDAAALQVVERRREEEARKQDPHRARRRRRHAGKEEEPPPSNTSTSTSTSTSRPPSPPPSSPSPSSPSLSLELGNFIHLASQPSWQHTQDAVVTCYFIDTGPNILSYLWSIHSLLKPGGYWINLGMYIYVCVCIHIYMYMYTIFEFIFPPLLTHTHTQAL